MLAPYLDDGKSSRFALRVTNSRAIPHPNLSQRVIAVLQVEGARRGAGTDHTPHRHELLCAVGIDDAQPIEHQCLVFHRHPDAFELAFVADEPDAVELGAGEPACRLRPEQHPTLIELLAAALRPEPAFIVLAIE